MHLLATGPARTRDSRSATGTGAAGAAGAGGAKVALRRGARRICCLQNLDPMKSFGKDVADSYDDELGGDETVACLEQLANGGPVLELAIDTGSIGRRSPCTGAQVDGVEQSAVMIAR